MAEPFLKRKKVLFLCRENACRSQMAAAFTRQLASDRFEAESAGNEPAEQVNSLMEKVMAEKGIDMAYLTPSAISDLPDGWQPDAVITMGCDVACPVFPGVVPREWDLPDPALESIDFMRNVCDQVEQRVKDLIRKDSL